MSTTTKINEQLALFARGDAAAKNALIGIAYRRLLELTRRHLRGYPGVRREHETAAVFSEAYERLSRAVEAVFGRNPTSDAAPPVPEKPPEAIDFFRIVAQHIRWHLQDLARKGKRGENPPPPPVPIGTGRGTEPGVDPPAGPADRDVVLDFLAAVEKLSPDSQQAFDLVHFNGLTIKEAAQGTGRSYDQMKRQWALAQVELGKLMQDYAHIGTPTRRPPEPPPPAAT